MEEVELRIVGEVMKTAEEKAIEYSNSEGIYNEHGEMLLYMGYLEGYNEAMRWRDPGLEPPEDFEHVLVKYEFTDGSGNVQIGYDVDMFVGHEGDFHLIDNVIGWRPIE